MTHIEKIGSILLAVSLALPAAPMVKAVDTAFTIHLCATEAGTASAEPAAGSTPTFEVGEKISVTLHLDQNAGQSYTLFGMQDAICFDPAILRFVEGSLSIPAALTGFDTSAQAFDDETINRIYVNYADASEDASGIFMSPSTAVVSFQLEACKTGTTSLTHDAPEIFDQMKPFQPNPSVAEQALELLIVPVGTKPTPTLTPTPTVTPTPTPTPTPIVTPTPTSTPVPTQAPSLGGDRVEHGGGSSRPVSTKQPSKPASSKQPDTPAVSSRPAEPAASARPSTAPPAIRPEATVNPAGEATSVITPQQITNVVNQFHNNAGGNSAIVIAPNVAAANKTPNKVHVTFQQDTLANVVQNTNAGLKIETSLGDVTVPADSLKELSQHNSHEIIVSVEVEPETAPSEKVINVSVTVDGRTIEKLDGGLLAATSVTTVPNGNVAVLVDEQGQETILQKSIVNNGVIKALVDGSCTLKIIQNDKTFADVSGHWADDSIAFAASHEIFQGVSKTEFAPDLPMDRAMLAAVLYRLENSPDILSSSVSFPDVASDAWYTKSVAWAAQTGIVTGYGNGLFGPADCITREQLAVMLYRYAACVGMDTSASGSLSNFQDSGSVSDWASRAMQWAVGTGLLTGKENARLDPGGNATRAEVAAITQRLLKRMLHA